MTSDQDADVCPQCGMEYTTHHASVTSAFENQLRSDATVCTEPLPNGMANKYKVWVHV